MNTSVASGPKPMPPMSMRWLVQENSATQLARPVERRRRDDEIVEMAGAHPRVVGDVGVARLHGLEREVADEVLHRLGHRVDVAGRAGHRLRQHAALEVEHAGREVAALAHDRRERGAHQHLRLLLDHRDQAVPHDLQVDEVVAAVMVRTLLVIPEAAKRLSGIHLTVQRVGGCQWSPARAIAPRTTRVNALPRSRARGDIMPSAPSRYTRRRRCARRSSRSTKVEVSSSAMIAGPGTRTPASMRSRR